MIKKNKVNILYDLLLTVRHMGRYSSYRVAALLKNIHMQYIEKWTRTMFMIDL